MGKFNAAGAEDAEGAQRKADSRFEISNLKTETSKLAVSRLNSLCPLCELCACGVESEFRYAQD
ncbi:MAG: hypothetical protein M3379_15485 [Acidobacteriota bacterium]|nr:hypothetical protein [Acidobacteriota bacterium]